MKKIKAKFIALIATIVLAGCDNSIQRANNAIGLMQEQMTKIVNELHEIKNLESNLQQDFEQALSSTGDQLTAFNEKGTLVFQNIDNRTQHLEMMEKHLKKLTDLVPELLNSKKNPQLPATDFDQLNSMIQNFATDLTTYITDYRHNLDLEKQTFNSISNPQIDYTSFFQVFDNINKLSETNLYNLDRLLIHFEPINRLLVDVKVKIVTLQEK